MDEKYEPSEKAMYPPPFLFHVFPSTYDEGYISAALSAGMRDVSVRYSTPSSSL